MSKFWPSELIEDKLDMLKTVMLENGNQFHFVAKSSKISAKKEKVSTVIKKSEYMYLHFKEG